MNIVVVFASEVEAHNFTIPKDSNHTISVLVSGVGSYATLYSLTKYCIQNTPDVILHAGICGTFTTLPLGTVVQVVSDCFADVGVQEQQSFKTLFEMNLANADLYPFTQGWLNLTDYLLPFLPQVHAITVNTISSSPQHIAMYINTYNPHIETMEGAAVHYVALQEHIPCIHIRAVSNAVGDRDKEKWNISGAVSNLHEVIHSIIAEIENYFL